MTRLNFSNRRVHHEGGDDEHQEIALRHVFLRDLRAPVPHQAHDSEAAEEFHQRWQDCDRARDLQVRPVQPLGRVPEPPAFPSLCPERLHDPVAGERLGRDMREMLELLLPPPGAPAHTLPEADERIDGNRRARHAHEREPEVHVEHDSAA